MSAPQGFSDKAAFIWKVADKLRGSFKRHEYSSVILPLLALRRFDAMLDDTQPHLRDTSLDDTSQLTMRWVLVDDKDIASRLRVRIRALAAPAAELIDAYSFEDKITRMDKAGILPAVLSDFAELDLRPSQVSNEAMGYIFEELLRKFAEMSNETAGEHYTPREVIHLMIDLLLSGNDAQEIEASPLPTRSVYDPAAGTGGMLTGAIARFKELNPAAIVDVYGQELNDQTWAIARLDLMLQGIGPERMSHGNSLTADAYAGQQFDYILANPPYGVDWKSYAIPIKEEARNRGWSGRFGAGLPRISDGSFLFLQHMISKMKPGVSRLGIVLSGAALFAGAAGSGESEIRRWIIENDWLEGIVALPGNMFYNTGIPTYIWILTKNKRPEDRGQVKLVDARAMGTRMRKSLGDKRQELAQGAIAEIGQLYRDAPVGDTRIKTLHNEAFGFQRITVESPMRKAGQRHRERTANPDLRDQENVPLPDGYIGMDDEQRAKALWQATEDYLEREVLPYVPAAWIDRRKAKIGYEIPFSRQFYRYTPPRPVEEIAAEIRALEAQIQIWMKGLRL